MKIYWEKFLFIQKLTKGHILLIRFEPTIVRGRKVFILISKFGYGMEDSWKNVKFLGSLDPRIKSLPFFNSVRARMWLVGFDFGFDFGGKVFNFFGK